MSSKLKESIDVKFKVIEQLLNYKSGRANYFGMVLYVQILDSLFKTEEQKKEHQKNDRLIHLLSQLLENHEEVKKIVTINYHIDNKDFTLNSTHLEDFTKMLAHFIQIGEARRLSENNKKLYIELLEILDESFGSILKTTSSIKLEIVHQNLKITKSRYLLLDSLHLLSESYWQLVDSSVSRKTYELDKKLITARKKEELNLYRDQMKSLNKFIAPCLTYILNEYLKVPQDGEMLPYYAEIKMFVMELTRILVKLETAHSLVVKYNKENGIAKNNPTEKLNEVSNMIKYFTPLHSVHKKNCLESIERAILSCKQNSYASKLDYVEDLAEIKKQTSNSR